ncbi:hypothetical protein H0H93_015086 [Arthromyces matolae]|nr:hypothetical protein H0H93_015086 [Arthromyces matolae]
MMLTTIDFDLDTIKMLMGMFVCILLFEYNIMRSFEFYIEDTDRNGTINFREFAGLWKYISDWQNVFRHFDRDHSGSIEGRELADALQSFGYNLAPHLMTLIERKYASGPSAGYGPPSGITFDRFVRACVVVKTLTEAFQRYVQLYGSLIPCSSAPKGSTPTDLVGFI